MYASSNNIFPKRRNSMMPDKPDPVSLKQAADMIIMSQNLKFRLSRKRSNPYCSSTYRSYKSPFY